MVRANHLTRRESIRHVHRLVDESTCDLFIVIKESKVRHRSCLLLENLVEGNQIVKRLRDWDVLNELLQ